MYENNFEENKNNEVKEIAIPNQENYNKEEVKEQIKEEQKKSVEKKEEEDSKKKKRTYKDFGLTPAKVLKFAKVAERDNKIEEILKLIKNYCNKLGIDFSKDFLKDIEEKIKNAFEDAKNKKEKK
jgi:hypothetical protein